MEGRMDGSEYVFIWRCKLGKVLGREGRGY